MRGAIWCVFVAMSVCLTLPVRGENRGGVYVDDIVVTNNGRTVFAEKFSGGDAGTWLHYNSTKAVVWQIEPGVVIFQIAKKPVNYCMYFNRASEINTGAVHRLVCNNLGKLEFKAKVYLPALEEQWGYVHNGEDATQFDINAAPDQDRFEVEILTRPGEEGYRLALIRFNPREKSPQGGPVTDSHVSDVPIIAPGMWTEIDLILDPRAKAATLSADGRTIVGCDYDPANIRSLTDLDITTWTGDKEPTKKPSPSAAKS